MTATARLLAVPDGAAHPEVLVRDDGAVVVRWFRGRETLGYEYWSVTLSNDRRTINVDLHHVDEEPVYLSYVLDAVRHILQYESGVNVNISVQQHNSQLP